LLSLLLLFKKLLGATCI